MGLYVTVELPKFCMEFQSMEGILTSEQNIERWWRAKFLRATKNLYYIVIVWFKSLD